MNVGNKKQEDFYETQLVWDRGYKQRQPITGIEMAITCMLMELFFQCVFFH